MSQNIYYGTIVSKISGHFMQNCDHISMVVANDNEQVIWHTCTEASRVFYALENIIDDVDIDWELAVEEYADAVLNHLITGDKPQTPDFLLMASQTIQNYQ